MRVCVYIYSILWYVYIYIWYVYIYIYIVLCIYIYYIISYTIICYILIYESYTGVHLFICLYSIGWNYSHVCCILCIIYQPSPACSKRSASAETMYKSDRPASLRCCGTIGWLLCIPQVKDNFQPSSYREYHVVVVSFNSSTIFLSYRLITSSSCILLFRLTYLCISLVLERFGLKKTLEALAKQHDNMTTLHDGGHFRFSSTRASALSLLSKATCQGDQGDAGASEHRICVAQRLQGESCVIIPYGIGTFPRAYWSVLYLLLKVHG